MPPDALELRKYPCSRCGAQPGDPCKGVVFGKVTKTSVRPHVERVAAYDEARAGTDDDSVIQMWGRVHNPRRALQILVQNWQFIGTDPYYRDLNDALAEMAERCSK